MFRAGVLLLPIVTVEFWQSGLSLRADLAPLQGFCILAGGVAAFALWNNALRWWSTSKVLLFNNLIPLSTMSWARICLGEPITPTFWLAMLLVASGVILGQTDWRNLAGRRVRECP
jgi:drug/metabolite transporter (DMT)-like permease